MATLSLKKPKVIGTTPLVDLDSKFVVMRQSRGFKSFRFTAVHESKEIAQREAGRLANANPSERFLVLQIQGYAELVG